jgi:hypothetical protein
MFVCGGGKILLSTVSVHNTTKTSAVEDGKMLPE